LAYESTGVEFISRNYPKIKSRFQAVVFR
jgi:hypothetical protein